MKNLFVTLTLLAICFISCNNKQTTDNKFTTDSLSYSKKDTIAEVWLKVDFPVTENHILKNAISEFISEELGGTYDSDMTNAQAMLKYYGDTLYQDLVDDALEFDIQDMPPLTYSQSINISHETQKYVTFIADTYVYMGGAHGMSTKQGSTFRKSDGRRFSYEMLKKTEGAEFKQMIKNGLKKYFVDNGVEINNDETLANMLLTEDDINFLPLPDFAPYLTKDGITFIYQQYEIAPYAAGMPSFTISYNDMLPYMTNTAKEFIEQ